MQVKIKKLHPEAITPTYATDGSGAFDISTIEEPQMFGSSHVFSTGLAFEIPKDYVLLVFSRSGHGFKQNVRLANCVGVIDSDYRGELKVKLTNDDTYNDIFTQKNERIAQGIIIEAKQVQFLVVDELSETERGSGGFGSTGK